MEPLEINTHLLVNRDEFTNALRSVVLRCGCNSSRIASLRFEDGFLHICAGTVLAAIPAVGSWPWTVVTDWSWISRLAAKPLKTDPVRIYIENGRVFAERFSNSCRLPDHGAPLEPETPAPNASLALERAARILAPLLVSSSQLEEIVQQAAGRKPLWREDDRKVVAMVAKAWAELAFLGVDPSDFHSAIERACKNAWNTTTLSRDKR
jgi:hypothetical protein